MRLKQSWFRWTGCGMVLLLALSPLAWAQAAGRGGLSGLVDDSSGAAIPGAAVVLTNTATGVTQRTQSSGAGLYSFVGLVPGDYTLEVSHPGFQSTRQEHIPVVVDQSAKLNVKLSVGSEAQQVTVTAAPALVDTTSTTTAQLIDNTVIRRMPLVSRSVYQLAELSPGMVPARGAESRGNSGPSGVSDFSVNGSFSDSLQFIVDGSPTTTATGDPGAVAPMLTVPLDSVQEFRVELSTVPANFQSYGAGIISVVTKSGTNGFHGDAFGFIRPNALNANDPFTIASQAAAGEPNKPTPFSDKQFGGSIGGPIVKNRLFFFGDYQGTREINATSSTFTVPTAAEKKGQFAFPIYNPFNITNGPSCPAPGPACPQPFPGNQIPANMINPVATAYLSGWPAPNQPGDGQYHINNFFGTGSSPEADNAFDVRIDGVLTQNQHLFGRVSWMHQNTAAGPNYSNSVLYPTSNNINHTVNAQVGYDWSLTPNAVLEVRASVARQFNVGGPTAQYGYDMTKLGFPAALAEESLFSTVPGITFSSTNSGFGASSSELGLGSASYAVNQQGTTAYDTNATLNLILGRNQMSVGWDFQEQYQNQAAPISPSGDYNFDSAATSSNALAGNGSAFASFLLGVGSLGQSLNFTEDASAAKSYPYTGLFFQDNIHVTPTLTVNAGVRWDIFGGENERYNRLTWFDTAAQYTVAGVPMVGGDQFVGPGNRSNFVTNWGDIGPRLGISWQPTSNLVVHSGFGYFYGPSEHSASVSEYAADGFTSSTSWSASTLNGNGDVVPVNLVNNPFPNGILLPSGSSLGPATNLGSAISSLDRHSPEPLTYNFNFGVQYQLPGQTVVSAGWVGSRGLRLPLTHLNLNTLPLSTIQQYGAALNTLVPYPYAAAITNPSAAWYGHAEVPQWVMLTSFPQFVSATSPAPLGGVQILNAGLADSIYHSLQAKIQKRMSHHFTWLASFTWSKSITNDGEAADFQGPASNTKPQDQYNLYLERTLSNNDVPLVLTLEESWDLPIGAGRALGFGGWANEAFGGWTLSGIATFTSGVPISTPSGTGDPWLNQRPDQVASCAIGAPRTPQQWLNYSCLAQPASPYLPGTAAATLPGIRADGTHNLDLSIAKHFPMGEQRNLEFRFAAYNFTNSVQWGYPHVFWHPTQTASNMAGFGQVTNTANTPRQVSAELKFTF